MKCSVNQEDKTTNPCQELKDGSKLILLLPESSDILPAFLRISNSFQYADWFCPVHLLSSVFGVNHLHVPDAYYLTVSR